MSSSSARHRKPSRFSASASAEPVRHRHRKQTRSHLLGRGPAVIVAAAGITVVAGGAAFAVTSWPAPPSHSASALSDVLKDEAAGTSAAGRHGVGQNNDGPLAASASQHTSASAPASSAQKGRPNARAAKTAAHHGNAVAAPPPVYRNPLRDITGLIPERVDMGCDFGGSGPIYALGNAVITNATADNSGWPGGGWITYQLTSGPAAGLQVYVAEDVTPAAGPEVS